MKYGEDYRMIFDTKMLNSAGKYITTCPPCEIDKISEKYTFLLTVKTILNTTNDFCLFRCSVTRLSKESEESIFIDDTICNSWYINENFLFDNGGYLKKDWCMLDVQALKILDMNKDRSSRIFNNAERWKNDIINYRLQRKIMFDRLERELNTNKPKTILYDVE